MEDADLVGKILSAWLTLVLGLILLPSAFGVSLGISEIYMKILVKTLEGENELVQNVNEPCRIESVEGNQEEVLMNQLMRVLFGQNPDFGSTFRSISSGFITTQQVLELLLPSALLSIVGTWMHQSSQALPHPLGLMILQLLLPYLQHCMGSLNVEHEAHPLLALPEDVNAGQAEHPEPSHGAALVPSEVAVPSPGVQLTSSLSEVSTRSSPLPLYNHRGGDTCSIHVHLENQSTTEYKSMVVTCQDRAPAIIRRALDEHLLNEEDPQDFELLQVVSEHRKLRIPDDGNVFQAINPHVNFNFIIRRKLTRKCAQVKRKELLESTSVVRAVTPPAMSSSSSAAASALHEATKREVPRNNRVTNSSSSPPDDLEGSRFILVRLEEQSRRASKRVLVTCREKVLDIIRRALEQHSLEDEDPEDFELLRKVSAHETIQLPEHATIMFCMYPEVKYYFILRRRPISKRAKVKGKEFSESTPKASAMASNISPGSNSISSENIPPKPMATKRKKSSVIRRLLARSSRPQYNKQVGDSCLIRVRLEQQSEEHCRTVLVTCNDRAPVVIRRALEELLIPGNPEDYELGQIISPQQKLRIPNNANVFYGMNPRVRYDFLLRKRTYPNEEVDDWIHPKPPTYEAMEAQGHHWKLLTRICCCLSGQC